MIDDHTMRWLLILWLLTVALPAQDLLPTRAEQQRAQARFKQLYRSRHAMVRAQALQELASMDFPWRVKLLVGVLEGERRRPLAEAALVLPTAIAVLGTTRHPEGVELLVEALLEENDRDLRLDLLESLAHVPLDEEGNRPLPRERMATVLEEGLGGEDLTRMLRALELTAALGSTDLLPRVLELVAHPEGAVCSAAVRALVRLQQDPDRPRGLEELIARLPRERGRLRGEIAGALHRLTGWECKLDADCWRRTHEAWSAGRQQLGPGQDPEQATTSFFGVPLLSERILFVIDTSPSMLEPYVVEKGPGAGRRTTKWQLAREELARAIQALGGEQSFNILLFDRTVRRWERELVPATKRWKERAITRLQAEQLRQRSMTNFHGALEEALDLAGPGLWSSGGSQWIDTLVFLTDGHPTTGPVSLNTPLQDEHGRPRRDARGNPVTMSVSDCYRLLGGLVAQRNRQHRVTIHTVGIGRAHARRLLHRLAKDSGGTYRTVEEELERRGR